METNANTTEHEHIHCSSDLEPIDATWIARISGYKLQETQHIFHETSSIKQLEFIDVPTWTYQIPYFSHPPLLRH
jgi:hypothetical protein